jgi:transposase
MARYEQIDTSPRFLAVDLKAQLLPGTFEHALNHLLDQEIDLSAFDARFNNDDTGATAFPPAMLLKVVLLAYSRGVISSRGIERLCRDHVIFIAQSGDRCPHCTAIADLISCLGDLIGQVFKQVLLVCDAQSLICRHLSAIGSGSLINAAEG